MLADTVQKYVNIGAFGGIACYIYGKRHIRHAGSFQKVIYPVYATSVFMTGSWWMWEFMRQTLRDQQFFDYHWKCLFGVVSAFGFLYCGRSYMLFIDHW